MTLSINDFLIVAKLTEYNNIEDAYDIYSSLLQKYSDEEVFDIINKEQYATWATWDDIIADIFISNNVNIPNLNKFIDQNRIILIVLLDACEQYVEIGNNPDRKGMVVEIFKK